MTKTDAKNTLITKLDEIKAKQKDLRKQFKETIDKAYAEQRAAMKALREQKAQIWTTYQSEMTTIKSERKAEAAKAKAEQKTNVGKIDAAEVLANGEAALMKAAAEIAE